MITFLFAMYSEMSNAVGGHEALSTSTLGKGEPTAVHGRRGGFENRKRRRQLQRNAAAAARKEHGPQLVHHQQEPVLSVCWPAAGARSPMVMARAFVRSAFEEALIAAERATRASMVSELCKQKMNTTTRGEQSNKHDYATSARSCLARHQSWVCHV